MLILVQPLDRSTGARVDIRAGSTADATALGLNGTLWEPLVTRRPRTSQELMSLDLDGKIKTAAADLMLSIGRMTQHSAPENLIWAGAPITIWRVSEMNWATRVVEFQGRVREAPDAPFDLKSKRITLNCETDKLRLDKPVLTAEFTGGGGANGDAASRGVLKPAGWGFNECIEWVLFDPINNIGMLDGYGNLLSVQFAYEGLNSLGASVGDYASYAALLAAITAHTIPPGRWGTCLAEGMVGFGAPPVGEVRFTATFGTNRSGALMRHLVEVRAGVAVGEIDTASFVALDAAVNREIRVHLRDQIKVLDMVENLCLPINTTPLVTLQNMIGVSRAVASAAVLTLDRSPNTPPLVTDWQATDPVVPTYKIIMRCERPGSVVDTDQVNYADNIIDRGLFDIAVVYRQGNLVWLPDGSSYLYINATAAAGHQPPVFSDAWWYQQSPPTKASDIVQDVDTVNMIPRPNDRFAWGLSGGGAARVHISDVRPAAADAVALTGANGAAYWSLPRPCTPGEILWFAHVVQADAAVLTGTDYVRGAYETFDATGAYLATYQLPLSAVQASDCPSIWTQGKTSFQVPAGTSFIGPFSIRPVASSGTMYVGEPYLGRAQPGADITSLNQHTLGDTADIHVTADHTGTVDAGQLPKQTNVIRLLGAIDVSDLSTYSATASGGVTVTVDSVGDPSPGLVEIPVQALPPVTDITVTTTYLGVELLKVFKVLRDDAAPPTTGGGGGGGTPGTPSSVYTFSPAPLSSGSYVQMATIPDVTTGSGGQVDLSINLYCDIQNSQGNIAPSVTDPDYTGLDLLVEYTTTGGSSWSTVSPSTYTQSGGWRYYSTEPVKGIQVGQGNTYFAASITGLGSGTVVGVRISGIQAALIGPPHGVSSVYGAGTSTPS